MNVFNEYFDIIESVHNNPSVDLMLLDDYNLSSANFSNSKTHFNVK